MMRHVWIDLEQPIDVPKLKRHGITRTYADARNASFSSEFERGIYRVQSWDNSPPDTFAKKLSDDVRFWGGDPMKQLAVHANIELHDPKFILSFLSYWRNRRPYRETALVIEGVQAGWFTQELVNRINADANLVVLAEAYSGAMERWDADNVRSNLTNYGIKRDKALVMYDAAQLMTFWDGCAFTQQRLK